MSTSRVARQAITFNNMDLLCEIELLAGVSKLFHSVMFGSILGIPNTIANSHRNRHADLHHTVPYLASCLS